MKIISLASGAGLWDWAWRDAGANIVLQCENASPQVDILKKAFPEAEHDYDIFTLNREKIENEYKIKPEECSFIGGLCCQPFSTAGPAKGREKDTWMCDELVRLAEECKPRFVISENVAGFIGHTDGLPYLIPQLERIGYYGHSLCIPASAFNSPHQRLRVFSFFARDMVQNPTSSERNLGTLLSSVSLRPLKPRFYNGRLTSFPGISPVVDGSPTKAEIDCLRICGNGVEYETGYFIASVVKAIHDYMYERVA